MNDRSAAAVRFVCFGEVLLRLSAPGHELLLQSPALKVDIGGAEANVAAALSGFGHTAALVSVLPANALGEAAFGELRRHGIDVRQVRRAPGRMGLYFLQTGAVQRASQVLYDRAHSAFALAPAQDYDWPALLHGAQVLHLSGVTPALGPNGAQAALDAARTARALGLHVVFDGNFRSSLWQAWNADPGPILAGIIGYADTVFADHRDLAIVLGQDFSHVPPARLARTAADAAFAVFPQLQRLIATQRVQHSVDHHELSAHWHTRDGTLFEPAWALGPIVDRIGAGDAFAAGVLHGLYSGLNDAQSLRFGLAAGCLKHSVPGDVLRLGAAEVHATLQERRFDVRR